MKWMCCVCAVVVALALTASCSSLQQSTTLDADQADLRAEYLANHPDGKFNDHITEGRVVKGMSIVEVLASWGLPNSRRSWKHDNAEYWVYYAKDEHTGQLMSYELIFSEQLLTRWVVNSDAVAGLGTAETTPGANRTIEETLKLGRATESTAGSTSKQKKESRALVRGRFCLSPPLACGGGGECFPETALSSFLP